MDKVIIFDTTLRDGEQAAGASLNAQEKLEIAKQLDKLGIDVIEAGFSASSPADFEAVKNKLGMRNISLPHLIKGEKDDYRNAFDSQSIQLVQDCYKERLKCSITILEN